MLLLMLAIVGAMPEEVDAIAAAMESGRTTTSGREGARRHFHTGTLKGHPLVIVQSRIGKVAAAATIAELITRHNVTRILFTGVAGALSPTLRIGDIVIATRLWQHDLDASPIFPPLEIPLLNRAHFDADPTLAQALTRAAHDFLQASSPAPGGGGAASPRAAERGAPRIHAGDIASGDQFITTDSQRARILTLIPTALCAEMEGAAAAQVAWEHDIPFAAIRSISDTADHAASTDFPTYLRTTAAPYAIGIAQRFVALLP